MEEISIRVGGHRIDPHPLGFTDDIHMDCEGCGAELMLRPGGPMPPEVRLLCLECAMPSLIEAKRNGTYEAEIVGSGKDTALGRLTKMLADAVVEAEAKK